MVREDTRGKGKGFLLSYSDPLTFVSSDPMQAVLQSLERQHEEEKRSALERQRQMYEMELQQLRKKLNPDRLSTGLSGQPASGHQQAHYRSMERLSVGGLSHSSSAQSRLRQWTEDRWRHSSGSHVNVHANQARVDRLPLSPCAPSGRWCW